MKELASDERIKEIIEEFNNLQIDKSNDLFASLYEFDRVSKQVFIVIEEHQDIYAFADLEKMLKEKIHKKILLAYIKNNKIFDNYLE